MPAPLLLDRLLQIADLFQRDMAREYEGTALSPARMAVLWTVHHAGPSPQHAIAEALDVTPRNITALVDALEGAGFVERLPHPTDRRTRLVGLTADGVSVMSRTTREHEALNATLLDAVDESDRQRVEAGLAAIAERLSAMVAEASASTSASASASASATERTT